MGESKDWRESDAAKERLKQVLLKSGVPLETRVLQIVRDFCKAHEVGGLRASAQGPMLWRESEDKAQREMDAGAVVRECIQFRNIEIIIEGQYAIEVKFREGVEWFAFASPHSTRLPVAGNFVLSEALFSAYNSVTENLPLSRLASLKTEGGIADSPEKSVPFTEKLTQNVSGAMADFVRHVAPGTLPAVRNWNVQRFVHESGLLNEFNEFVGEDDDWRTALINFLDKIPVTTHQEFLTKHNGPHPIVLKFFVPILCTNGRMNHVEMSDDGAILDITPLEYAVTGERLEKWPERDLFLLPSDHFPLIVTNPEGLRAAMQVAYDLIRRVRDKLVLLGTQSSLGALALESVLTATVLEARAGLTTHVRPWAQDPRTL